MSELRLRAFGFHALAVAVILVGSTDAAEKKKTADQNPPTSMVLPRYFSSGELRIVSSSHQDTAWMNTPDFCRRFRIEQNIMPALERMRIDPDYTFCMEGMLHLMEFLEAHPELEKEVIQRTREGRFEWGATYNQPYESWFSGEELVREIYFGRRWLRKHFPGCDAKVAFNPDPPARSLQMQQILAKAGVPYMFISRYHEGLYRWGSPDGSSILAYTPGQYGNHAPLLNAEPAKAVGAIRAKLEQQEPYYAKRGIPPIYALINSRDFSKPVDFSPLIEFWNGQPAGRAGATPPKMQYSSICSFFEAIDQPAAKFDTVVGERPDVWVYITGPTHRRMDSMRREGARLLPAAEMFTTFASFLQGGFRDWPRTEFAAAWMDQIYVDHGIGGRNGHVSDEVFLRKVTHARDSGRSLLDRALGTIAAQVKTEPDRGQPVVVFNLLSWQRSDVVEVALPAALAAAEHVTVVDPDGREVATQFSTLSEPDEVNVAAAAVGAKATASSSGWGHGPEKAIDGSWAVREWDVELGAADQWRSAPGAGPHSLTIDFGQPRTIHKVVLRHEGVIGAFDAEARFNTSDFRVQGADSADGPWTDLIAPIKENAASFTVHEFAPRSVQFLRLLVTKPAQSDDTDLARIFELQAFAKAPPKARRLVFVADHVPALGYKTYYLSAAKSANSTATPAATTAGCENRYFRVTLANGGVKSIFDRQQGRELLDSTKFLGGEVFTMLSVAEDNRALGTDAGHFGSMPLPVMDDSFDRVARYKPNWKLIEHGPVRSVFELEQPLADVKVRQRAIVWHSLKRIDCEVDLVEFSGKFWREFRMALPLALEKPRLLYEVPMGVVEIGKDEIPTTGGLAHTKVGHGRTLEYTEQCRDIHPRQVQNFVDASDARGGLTMSSSVSVFDWIDPTTSTTSTKPLLQPVLLASRKSCNIQGVWYPQTGDHSYRFSLTPHEGGWRNGWRPGVAANDPLRAVIPKPSQATALPPALSFASISADNIIVSAIKKCEDDDTVIVRLYDIEGRDTRATLNFFRPVSTAKKTNIIEDDGEPLRVEHGRVTIPIGHHEIETLKLAPTRSIAVGGL